MDERGRAARVEVEREEPATVRRADAAPRVPGHEAQAALAPRPQRLRLQPLAPEIVETHHVAGRAGCVQVLDQEQARAVRRDRLDLEVAAEAQDVCDAALDRIGDEDLGSGPAATRERDPATRRGHAADGETALDLEDARGRTRGDAVPGDCRAPAGERGDVPAA